MRPEEYTGKEWTELLRQMNTREIRKLLKQAYRREAKELRRMAVGSLGSSGMSVTGNSSDWDKGIRSYVYSRGGGFLVTVKPRKAGRNGKGEKGMHVNRYGKAKPVLLWAEDGTKARRTRGSRSGLFGRKKGHSTGTMPGFHFLARVEPQMKEHVEENLAKEVESATYRVAKKCGFI